MFDRTLNKILLYPFSLVYGFVISLRNLFYDSGVLKASKFSLPIINVGNLTMGGAGKTPHIEYLIRLLKDYINVATLSRGYKRKSKGFKWVNYNDNAEQAGDEPLQFRRKFNEIQVAVAESRSFAIPQIVQRFPQTHTILLDDAFQHRSVDAGLNILLTEFDKPYTRDMLLPAGRLREFRSGSERANIVIVSKCPQKITEQEKSDLREELQLEDNQRLFFSYYHYLNPYFIFDKNITKPLDKNLKVIVLAALAKADYLLDYLNDTVDVIQIVKFEDHHYFSAQEMGRLAITLEEYKDEEIIILTTEKDAIRLELHRDFINDQSLSIFVLPIEVKFHFNESELFDRSIKDFLLNFKV